MVERNPNGTIKSGSVLNPNGVTKSGRAKAFALVDVICGKKKNLLKLQIAMQNAFDNDPMKFFKEIIMPLAPKDVNLNLNELWASKTPDEICEDMDNLTTGGDAKNVGQ